MIAQLIITFIVLVLAWFIAQAVVKIPNVSATILAIGQLFVWIIAALVILGIWGILGGMGHSVQIN